MGSVVQGFRRFQTRFRLRSVRVCILWIRQAQGTRTAKFWPTNSLTKVLTNLHTGVYMKFPPKSTRRLMFSVSHAPLDPHEYSHKSAHENVHESALGRSSHVLFSHVLVLAHWIQVSNVGARCTPTRSRGKFGEPVRPHQPSTENYDACDMERERQSRFTWKCMTSRYEPGLQKGSTNKKNLPISGMRDQHEEETSCHWEYSGKPRHLHYWVRKRSTS